MQSAPWYTELLLDGALVAVVVVVCIILKADYLEKVKVITSYFRKEMVNMWWSIGGGIIIFALGMFIFLKPGLIWKLTEEWKSYRADEPSEFYLKATKNRWYFICPIWNYYDYASGYFGVTISSL